MLVEIFCLNNITGVTVKCEAKVSAKITTLIDNYWQDFYAEYKIE